MSKSPYARVTKTFGAVLISLSLQSLSHAGAIGMLNPLFTSGAGLSSGGLAGDWYKVDNNAKFSNAKWQGDTIKDTGWGTGIWSVADVVSMATIPAPSYVTGFQTRVGAVSYANNIYNNTFKSGQYGVWGADYMRPLAPPVGLANLCDTSSQDSPACANEQNYAAVFSGYIYVATASWYDFGVFADDVFNFSLFGGNNGFYGMSHDNVAGSPGRVQESLLKKNGLEALKLNQGFYAVELSYANRLESGVLDLGWKGLGDTSWKTIDGAVLYHSVPEPATLILLSMGMLGVWSSRRFRAQPIKSRFS